MPKVTQLVLGRALSRTSLLAPGVRLLQAALLPRQANVMGLGLQKLQVRSVFSNAQQGGKSVHFLLGSLNFFSGLWGAL